MRLSDERTRLTINKSGQATVLTPLVESEVGGWLVWLLCYKVIESQKNGLNQLWKSPSPLYVNLNTYNPQAFSLPL